MTTVSTGLIDDLFKSIEKARYLETMLETLKQENIELKYKHYKDEELFKLKEENRQLKDALSNGFPIYEDEKERIEKWITKEYKKNPSKSIKYPPHMITKYEFTMTELGTIGTVHCRFGNKFCFREI